jgi:uncharacterized membrane protein YcjF (UPF0283 family)
MAEKHFDEKDEKQFDEKDEKELRKHDEKIEERDTLSSVVWAAILIWAGVVFLAANTGWLDSIISHSFIMRYLPHEMVMFEPVIWGFIMLGAGVILVAEAFIRLLVPSLKRRVLGALILGVIFIGIGMGNFFGWDLVWPFILIVLGISVLAGGLLRSKK